MVGAWRQRDSRSLFVRLVRCLRCYGNGHVRGPGPGRPRCVSCAFCGRWRRPREVCSAPGPTSSMYFARLRASTTVQHSSVPRAGAGASESPTAACWRARRPVPPPGLHYTSCWPFVTPLHGAGAAIHLAPAVTYALSRSIAPCRPGRAEMCSAPGPWGRVHGAPSLTDNCGVLGRLAACLRGWMDCTGAAPPAAGVSIGQWPWYLSINVTCPRFRDLPCS